MGFSFNASLEPQRRAQKRGRLAEGAVAHKGDCAVEMTLASDAVSLPLEQGSGSIASKFGLMHTLSEDPSAGSTPNRKSHSPGECFLETHSLERFLQMVQVRRIPQQKKTPFIPKFGPLDVGKRIRTQEPGRDYQTGLEGCAALH
jgi:hypothetical protein